MNNTAFVTVYQKIMYDQTGNKYYIENKKAQIQLLSCGN